MIGKSGNTFGMVYFILSNVYVGQLDAQTWDIWAIPKPF